MAIVYLGIGSNVGNKEKNCREAIDLLNSEQKIEVTGASSLYITEPVGGPEQDDYLNGVIKIETDLLPRQLINTIKDIESKMGRIVYDEKNQPRIIDVDILFYEDLVIKKEGLEVPHPRMHQRAFVLRGFSEIAPEALHPALNKTVKELYTELRRR